MQFEEEGDGVYDTQEPRHYQKKTPPATRPQEAAGIQDDWSFTNESIPAKIRKCKHRTEVGSFLETPVTFPMWQALDQSHVG